jgi:sugar O-acyltransferase (sialic acid O-acetyltransferase NeuD family)
MQGLLIVGSGIFAQMVAETLTLYGQKWDVKLIGYVDDDVSQHNTTRLGIPVLGDIRSRKNVDYDVVIVTISDNLMRSRVFRELQREGERFTSVVHPQAIVAPGVSIGVGTIVCARAVISTGSIIGENVIVDAAVSVDHHNYIGDHVCITNGAHLGGNVTVGEGTLIGIGATVMPQIKLGSWSTVGAAALIHRDLPSNVVAVGVPAIIVG